MRPNLGGFGVALLAAAPLCSSAAEPSECASTIYPLHTPRPSYPSPKDAIAYLDGTRYLDTFVEGSVRVRFLILESGEVTDVVVVEEKTRPIGRDANRYPSDYFIGFLAMYAADTVLMWRYQPIEAPCFAEASFEYTLDPDA